jgi:hypothetical protein
MARAVKNVRTGYYSLGLFKKKKKKEEKRSWRGTFVI